MPALTRAVRTGPQWGIRAATLFILIVGLLAGAAGCKAKASRDACDRLIDRYAQLIVTERYPDASAAQVGAEREREKREARGDDAFKNCSSQVTQAELGCAMRAPSADAFEKCLE